jgi:DNA-binding winged helix-turn-helix (wHTH) protein/tetratricopeptide (TPR) repeat protein
MPLLAFGVYELDTESGELRRQGRRVHLAAQPFTVLSILASRPGTVVSRDELVREVWGGQTFVDFERGLNFCIATVRSALKDDARSPRFIETLPRRGYRFIADVSVQEGVSVHADASVQADVSAQADGRIRADGGHGIDRGTAALPAIARRWAWVAALPLLLLAQLPASSRVHSRTTAVPAAREAFERGLGTSSGGPAGLRKSVYQFRLAARLDPRFAEAQYALGDTYLTLAGQRELPLGAALAEAHAAARRAAELEPLAATRQLLGTTRLLHEWDWEGARRDLAEAVRLAPSWDGALVSYARFLSAAGDDAAALEMIDRAEALSPSCDLLLFDSGAIRYRARRYDEAIVKLTRAAELGPPRGMSSTDWQKQVQSLKITIRLSQRDPDAARQEALKILQLNGVAESAQHAFGSRDAAEALRLFYRRSVDLMSRAEAGRIPPTRLAAAHAALGENGAALDWLERAAGEHDPEIVYMLRNPELDALRGDRRFRALEAGIHKTPPPRAQLIAGIAAAF